MNLSYSSITLLTILVKSDSSNLIIFFPIIIFYI
jgi:hypothetical protein